MKVFECDACGSLVFFENTECLSCKRPLGFLPAVMDLTALDSERDGQWIALTPAAGRRPCRPCANGIEHGACNWLIFAEDTASYCIACATNEVIPDLSVPGNKARWVHLEQAKRRVIYTLRRLGLPLDGARGGTGLRFRFIGDSAAGPQVVTGHQDGVITVNIAEADDVERERLRVSLHEPYRTLLGHLRHEVAHYYWDQLIANSPRQARFRELFGDESLDYVTALQSYYQQGPPADWSSRTISAYATSHPWEDWAETWAHYLHIVDTLETAASFGMVLRPRHAAARSMTARPRARVGLNHGFDEILENWLPLTYALNSLNRGMGLPDLYPFVLMEPAIAKLRFVHDVVQAGSAAASAAF